MKVYVASSWRNLEQPAVVAAIRAAGHEVYDFRHPAPGDNGFAWRAIDPGWETWTPEQYRANLQHPRAQDGFNLDMNALRWAEATVLVLPCGRSAHLELGYAVGAGQRTMVLLTQAEPELMYLMCTAMCLNLAEVLSELAKP